ncbi:MAG: CBS domain-containing protein [Nitrososphaera sp.]
MHTLFVILDENTTVSSAVKQMHSHNADTIIVVRGNMPVGIVTDSDIIDKVVMRGEDSDEVFSNQLCLRRLSPCLQKEL